MSRKLDFDRAKKRSEIYKIEPDLRIYSRPKSTMTLVPLWPKKQGRHSRRRQEQRALLADWNKRHGLPEDTPF